MKVIRTILVFSLIIFFFPVVTYSYDGNKCTHQYQNTGLLSEKILYNIDRIIARGDLKAFIGLIDCGGLNINARADNRTGSNLLSIAVQKKAHKFIKTLVDRGINIDTRDGDYNTPLFIAVENKDKVSIELLILHGANIHAKNKFNDSVFEQAIKYGIDLASYKVKSKMEKPPLFKEFPVNEIYKEKNHKLILDDFSKQFRTRLKKLIKADKPTFAGKYLVARWGCGSEGCNMGAIIDASTGKVYSFPVSMSSVYPIRPDAEGEGQELIYKINSRLMIFAGDLEGEKNYPDSVLFYEFTGKEFKLLKVLPYGKATTSNKTEELKADKKPEPVSKIPTNKPAEVTQVALTTTPPKNAEIIKAEKDEPIKTAKGSTSFTLLATMFGLLSLRLKNIV